MKRGAGAPSRPPTLAISAKLLFQLIDVFLADRQPPAAVVGADARDSILPPTPRHCSSGREVVPSATMQAPSASPVDHRGRLEAAL